MYIYIYICGIYLCEGVCWACWRSRAAPAGPIRHEGRISNPPRGRNRQWVGTYAVWYMYLRAPTRLGSGPHPDKILKILRKFQTKIVNVEISQNTVATECHLLNKNSNICQQTIKHTKQFFSIVSPIAYRLPIYCLAYSAHSAYSWLF